MAGFGILRDEEDVGVGSRFPNCHDDKMKRRIEFRYTMKSLNQTFINACQDELTRAPDCVLVPLIQNYLLYLRDTLTKLNEDSNDVDANSFTNIGKFYDTISKKLHRLSYSMDRPVFNNNNKELPPLKRRAPNDNSGLRSLSPNFSNPNAPSYVSTPLSGGFANRLSSSDGKRMMLSSKKIPEEPEQSDRNTFSGLCGFNSASASAQPTSSPNYFSDNSKQFNAGFMSSGSSKTTTSSPSLPSAGKPSMGSPQANSTPMFRKSPIVPNSIEGGSINSFNNNSRMSNSTSPAMLNKTSPVKSPSSAVFPTQTQNTFGFSSNYWQHTNGISPSHAPVVLPKEGGFEMVSSKSFSSPQPQGSGNMFSVPQQHNSQTKPLGFSFSSPAPSFSAPVPAQPAVNNKDSDDEDTEPPKNEFTPVVESDSLYNIKCKVFYMSGGTYKDKGVGQLYVKKLDSGKYQLVVRADNTLGTVLLNLLLAKTLPLSKKSAKDIITVDPQGNKGEPATVLIRVRDESSATELLNKLTQFKSSSS